MTVAFGTSGTFPSSNVCIAISPSTIYFADGSSVLWYIGTLADSYVVDTGIASASGTWYIILWIVLAKLSSNVVSYISQTPPTAAQSLIPYMDGNIVLLYTTATSTYPPTKNSVSFNGGASGSSGRRPGS